MKPRTIPSARMPNLILFVWIISPSHLQNSTRNLYALRGLNGKPFRGARLKVRFIRWRITLWWFPIAAQNFLSRNICRNRRTPESIPHWLQTRSRRKSFAPAGRKNCDFTARRVRFDRIATSYDNYVYVTPAEGKQARRRNAGYKDGAKIYFCNRRSCFLTWKGRSCLLYRLSPRKSRFQSHPAEMRSVPEC